jgi:hypothetical protein
MRVHRLGTAPVCGVIGIALLFVVSSVAAQQEPATSTPSQESHGDASSTTSTASSTGPASEAPASTPGTPTADDRIFKVMPNFETVEGSATAPPLTVGEKFTLTAKGAFDPFEFALAGTLAGLSQAEDSDPTYRQGAAGYGKRYAAAFADLAIGNFMSGAILPALLREDPRYFQLGKGTFGHRFAYALSRIFVTPTDAGHIEFNYSEFLGNAAAAGISNAYSSPEDRTVGNAVGSFGEQLGVDMVGNELKEFWPGIRRKMFRKP